MTKMRRPSVAVRLAAVVFAFGSPGLAPVPASAAAGATEVTVVVSPAAGKPGDRVRIDIVGWPDGPVNVGVCGNSARRGSQDCDQITTEGVAVRGGVAALLVTLAVPPIGCPCVIRAASPNNSIVRMAPVAIEGVANVAPVEPGGLPPEGRALRVTAGVSPRGTSSLQYWASLVAGAAPRVLVLTLENISTQTLRNLRVVGGVGRDRANSEPIAAAAVSELAPGATRRVRIPLVLGAPAWGKYEVFGSVYGTAIPVRFSVETRNDPWALEVAVVLFVLLLAQLARREERARGVVSVTADTAAPDTGTTALQRNSPRVGASDEGRWPSAAYSPVATSPPATGTSRVITTVGGPAATTVLTPTPM